jgi:hypothetical protein
VILATSPGADYEATDCVGCGGTKKAPLACVVSIGHGDKGITLAICEECGRDTANAIGFMCIRDGGWSKLEPRKRKVSTR